MANKENKCKLGSSTGYTNSSDDEVNPVNNELAISQWHAALSRVIAYSWDHWEDGEEINNILRYPEYYLAKFGFFPQIPAYQTKIKFVIKHNDTVKYKYGGPDDSDKNGVKCHDDKCKDHAKGATITVIPQGDQKEARTVTMNRAMDYKSTTNVYTAGLVPLTDYNDSDREEEIRRTMEDCGYELENGWQFDNVNELTGCFIVAIPPKPEVEADSNADQDLIEMQALGDFMDICRSQPFTCS